MEVVQPNSSEEAEEWMAEHLGKSDFDVVGFDCEWRPSYQSGRSEKVALVQIASKKSTMLVQLNRFPQKQELEFLSRLCEDKKVLKVGVGILDDLKKLKADFGINYNSYLDLGKAAARLVYFSSPESFLSSSSSLAPPSTSANFPLLEEDEVTALSSSPSSPSSSSASSAASSLAALDDSQLKRLLLINSNSLFSLYRIHCCASVKSKPRSIQMSNWGAYELSYDQICYAVTDAVMALEIFEALQMQGVFSSDAVERHLELLSSSLREGGGGRAAVRKVFAAALESDVFVRLMVPRFQQDDEAWLASMQPSRVKPYRSARHVAASLVADSSSSSSSLSFPSSTQHADRWRNALLALASRLSWTISFNTISSSSSTSSTSSSSSSARTGSNSPSCVKIDVMGGSHAFPHPFLLARASGPNKAVATELACEEVARAFVAFQRYRCIRWLQNV